MDLISIIVPVYNVEQFLPKCLDSIVNQTYKNLEIILVDDGSTDNSGKICDEYAFKDNRIKVIHKVNGGLSDARNAGLDICTGDYIGFVDSDDYVEIDMYEILLNYLKENNLDVAMCASADVIDCKVICTPKFDSFTVDSKEDMIREIFVNKYGGASVSVWNKLYIKDVLKDVRFLKGKLYEDAFFLLDWIKNTKRFGRISDCKYYYVQRSGSITHLRYYNKNILDVVEAYERNLNIIKKKYPEVIDAGKFRLYWAYKVAVDRIHSCVDFEEHKEVVENLRKKLRKNIVGILKNQHINHKGKIGFLLMAMSIKFYFVIKNYIKVRNKKY